MKTRKMKLICALALALLTTGTSFAGSDSGTAIAIDAVVVRPVCLVATILGCAFFVISLPFAATSHSIDQTANALVCEPFDATFTRSMGDFDNL